MNFADAFLIFAFSVTSVFLFHNLFVLIVGFRSIRKNGLEIQTRNNEIRKVLPSFSIVLPVKNEHKVIQRLLRSISEIRYPPEKLEIVIVEDGSSDGTLEICKQFTSLNPNVKLLQRSVSNGKPSALNYAIKYCSGEIIGFFDADAVPADDILYKVADYFADSCVGAVQGRNLSINANENMLTQLITYEDRIWYETYLQGKEVLNLFVTLRGNCQFIRNTLLRQLGGFAENFLSEDIEISARITENDHRIRYGSDLLSYQETPSNLRAFLKQRTRWYTGNLQVAFKYKRLLGRFTLKRVDAELSLLSPIIGVLSLSSFFVAFLATTLLNYSFNGVLIGLLNLTAVATLLTLFLCGFALIYLSKPKKFRNLLWFPFLYGYLNLEVLITLYAAVLALFPKTRKWTKTEKSGAIANPEFKP